jgi:hypothetical protein
VPRGKNIPLGSISADLSKLHAPAQYKLGLLYECSAGTGKLLVCSIDLNSARASAASLRRSILDYMAGPRFQPTVTIAAADLRRQWVRMRPNSVDPGVNQPVVPSSPDLVAPGEIRRKPAS